MWKVHRLYKFWHDIKAEEKKTLWKQDGKNHYSKLSVKLWLYGGGVLVDVPVTGQ